MELCFFGTSAGMPTPHRNSAGVGLRFAQSRQWYLFDCGEGTQHQIMRSQYAMPRIAAIFISHLHGDHVYGLPGLLSTRHLLGADPAVRIVGPPGLRRFVTEVLAASHSGLHRSVQIEEAPAEGGELAPLDEARVTAVPVAHGVPCMAYLLQEPPRTGRFDIEKARAEGLPPGPHFGKLKAGEAVTLPDGRVLRPEDYVGPDRPGRRVLICWDNEDPAGLMRRAGPLDLLVHEATHTRAAADNLAWLPRHTTADAVAEAARDAAVRNLLLTHFSPRFGGGPRRPDTPHIDDVRDAAAAFPGKLELARDLRRYQLSVDGELSRA